MTSELSAAIYALATQDTIQIQLEVQLAYCVPVNMPIAQHALKTQLDNLIA
jgi:hypothetical protein